MVIQYEWQFTESLRYKKIGVLALLRFLVLLGRKAS